MLRRLLGYFRPHFTSLALAALCMVVVSAALGAQVFLIRNVLDGLLFRHDRAMLVWLPPAIIVLYGLQAIGEIGRGLLSRRVGQSVILQLRNQLYRHYQNLSIDFFQARTAGAMMSRVTHDVEAVQRAITAFITLLQKPLTLVVLISAAAWQEPRLTLMALVVLPLVALPIDRLGKQLRDYTRRSMNAMGDLNSILNESITGARIIRAFGMENYEIERFELETHKQYALSMKATVALILSGPVVQLFASVGAAAIVWYGGVAVIEGRSTAGSLLAFLVSLGLMNDPLKSLSQVPLFFTQTRVGAERIFEILDTSPSVQEKLGAYELGASQCSVELVDVSFGYDETPVLRGITLEARAGEVIALVGASGAGKSTILNLILRFYEVSGGSIKINGSDIRDLTLKSLRQHIGIVTQDTFLFNDTIRANIAHGDPSRAFSEIEEAARMANAETFIRELPEGYETRVGDQGLRLSGGQRQRIAIARALLKNAPILLLDEATSSLDQEAEDEVQRALEVLMRRRTTFVVAHRLSTVRRATRIAVIDAGTVAELGDHQALLAKGGTYARMYRKQSGQLETTTEPAEIAS